MVKVFVNGISAKSGGGRSILTNFLEVAHRRDDGFNYVVSVPSLDGYEAFANERVELFAMGWTSNTALIPMANMFFLPRLASRSQCDVVFNLADIPMRTRLPQVFLFDWPYAIYTQSPAWKTMSRRDYIVRHLKLFLFKLLLNQVDLTIAQSHLVQKKLEAQYDLSPVVVIKNSHHLESASATHNHDFALGGAFKVLCISRYYTHKNFEIMLPLARLIKERQSPIRIIVTLDADEAEGSRKFLNSVLEAGLGDVIVNVGSVPLDRVSALFRQVDALFLPTLLETLGLTYFEAMHCDKPILTSDLPFAKAVCGDAALYFDPFDAEAILASFEKIIADSELRKALISNGQAILQTMPSWEDTYDAYSHAFLTAMKSEK